MLGDIKDCHILLISCASCRSTQLRILMNNNNIHMFHNTTLYIPAGLFSHSNNIISQQQLISDSGPSLGVYQTCPNPLQLSSIPPSPSEGPSLENPTLDLQSTQEHLALVMDPAMNKSIFSSPPSA